MGLVAITLTFCD